MEKPLKSSREGTFGFLNQYTPPGLSLEVVSPLQHVPNAHFLSFLSAKSPILVRSALEFRGDRKTDILWYGRGNKDLSVFTHSTLQRIIALEKGEFLSSQPSVSSLSSVSRQQSLILKLSSQSGLCSLHSFRCVPQQRFSPLPTLIDPPQQAIHPHGSGLEHVAGLVQKLAHDLPSREAEP